jgi:response regulator of citrate/malate metabolism
MLTDLGLPDGNGMDLVRRVSEAQPDMAVIIASGADLREHVEGSGLGGRITGLVKPYDQRSLEIALQQCVGGSRRPRVKCGVFSGPADE